MTTTILKERRMVRRFEEAGALSPDSAQSLEHVGISSGRILRRLRDRLVVRHIEGDRFYVDEEVWAAVRKQRRRHASVAAIAALALILGLLLFTKTAHAVDDEGCTCTTPCTVPLHSRVHSPRRSCILAPAEGFTRSRWSGH